MPERWKWCLPWELEAHFEKVSADRDKKYGGGSKSSGGEDIPDPVQNEHAARFR